MSPDSKADINIKFVTVNIYDDIYDYIFYNLIHWLKIIYINLYKYIYIYIYIYI